MARINNIKCEVVGNLKDKRYNEMTSRVYSPNGLAPTIKTMNGGGAEPKIIMGGIEDMNPIEKEILAVDGFNQSTRADQTCFGTITRNAGADLKRNGQGVIEIVSRPHGSNKGGVVKSDIFPTVRKSATMDGNTGIVEPVIGAFRGRNPDNPSDRTPGAPTEQRLEINSRNLSNTLTTVQKDNVVVEPSEKQLRIRKLTPKECGRLMGVRDSDIDIMSKNQSNSSLYHLFGDSIVVDVLMAIFKQMI